MEIVINKCYGGFGLSLETQKEINKLGCSHSKWMDEDEYFGGSKTTRELDIKFWGSVENSRQRHVDLCGIVRENGKILNDNHRNYEARNCPILVQVVKKLKSKANGQHAELKVIKIPDDVQWTIEEYDGVEWITEKHRTWG